jgi:acetyl-CoA synthetase
MAVNDTIAAALKDRPDSAKSVVNSFSNSATVTPELVQSLYEMAGQDQTGFWSVMAREFVSWARDWERDLVGDFTSPEVEWFAGGRLNAAYNCLDRHLESGRRNKAALIWQAENDRDVRVYTYQMLHSEVCRLANVLKKKGIRKGDCVSIYLPMIPELVVSMLACARIGAVHNVVFVGFSHICLQNRLRDCQARLLITADGARRAGTDIPLKSNADEALAECPGVSSCIVVKNTGRDVVMQPLKDSWYHDELYASDIFSSCNCVEVEANEPLFILYTSGATGSPKGVVHGTGGYLVYAMYTSRLVFDMHGDDIFWCSADIGWITGHTYTVYGPLGLGVTALMFEGVPLYPGPDRFWQVVEKFKVDSFYTAPPVIRALMRFGGEPVQKHDLSSLRLLGSVGEPINPEAWRWYREYVGKSRIPVVDTWLQTETGGVMIAPLPGTARNKPGCAALPLPGIDAVIVDDAGRIQEKHGSGRLVIKKPWPGMLKGIHGGQNYLGDNYLSVYPGKFDTGDGARCDEDGCFWLIGRLDDVIRVNGHRFGSVEIESALLTHESVVEAAVVGMPHSLKGQSIYAYVIVSHKTPRTPQLLEELRELVISEIGAIAAPDAIQFASALPKTRSGKIMRRLLKKIAADETRNLGDTSTLADPSVIADLIEGRIKS